MVYQMAPFYVSMLICDKNRKYECKKLQFRHELTANDTSKTAKITKR